MAAEAAACFQQVVLGIRFPGQLGPGSLRSSDFRVALQTQEISGKTRNREAEGGPRANIIPSFLRRRNRKGEALAAEFHLGFRVSAFENNSFPVRPRRGRDRDGAPRSVEKRRLLSTLGTLIYMGETDPRREDDSGERRARESGKKAVKGTWML